MTDRAGWHWVVCNTCIHENTYRVDRDEHITRQWMQEHAETTGHDDWHGNISIHIAGDHAE